jgi:hypothetical protein
MAHKEAAKMTRTHTEAIGEKLDASVFETAFPDEAQRA